MSCCGNNHKNFYARRFNNDCCCEHNNRDFDDKRDCKEERRPGISCPDAVNNDCTCAESLRDAACRLTNQRVIIYTDNCKMCVVIVSIGDCFIKTINPCTQKIVYFNLNRINNIEDVLPRCY